MIYYKDILTVLNYGQDIRKIYKVCNETKLTDRKEV